MTKSFMVTPVLAVIPWAFIASYRGRTPPGLEPAIKAEVPTVDQQDPIGWDVFITTKTQLAPVTGRPIPSLDGAVSDDFRISL